MARKRDGEALILSGVSFNIQKCETMALIGRTGAGKTMCALEIMGLLPLNIYASDAKIVLDGMDLTELSDKDRKKILGADIIYIPQNGSEYLNPSRSIGKQMFDSLKKAGIKRADLKKAALDKLALAGLEEGEELLSRFPFQLSGGMAQRVTIALAACVEPKLLIADEPTNGLDSKNRSKFVDMLKSRFPGSARIIITHDKRLEELCDFTYTIGGEYK